MKAAGTWKGQAYSGICCGKEGGLIRQADKRDSLKAYRCIGNVWLGICPHLPQAHASLHGSEKGVNLQERFQFGKDSLPPGQLDS